MSTVFRVRNKYGRYLVFDYTSRALVANIVPLNHNKPIMIDLLHVLGLNSYFIELAMNVALDHNRPIMIHLI